jgi:hypothetical protein
MLYLWTNIWNISGFLSKEDAETPGNTDSFIRRWQLTKYLKLIDIFHSIIYTWKIVFHFIRWVKDHISSFGRGFGGNPNSITIFGESAGGASFDFQIVTTFKR